MYKDFKYTLDFLFLFMLVVSLLIFSIGFFIDLHGTALDALQKIDFVILGGYYAFFMHGIYKAKSKITYCKKHWLMLGLLVIPFIPVARLMRFAHLERFVGIGTNTLWHFFDELGLL